MNLNTSTIFVFVYVFLSNLKTFLHINVTNHVSSSQITCEHGAVGVFSVILYLFSIWVSRRLSFIYLFKQIWRIGPL